MTRRTTGGDDSSFGQCLNDISPGNILETEQCVAREGLARRTDKLAIDSVADTVDESLAQLRQPLCAFLAAFPSSVVGDTLTNDPWGVLGATSQASLLSGAVDHRIVCET